ARSMNATANPAPASPAACARVATSWLVSAPSARKTAAGAATAAANSRLRPPLNPASSRMPTSQVIAATTAASTSTLPATPARALAVARRAVVRPVRNTSHRPAASSPRSTRVAVSSPQMATTRLAVPNTRQSTNPATVSTRYGSPSNARSPRLAARSVNTCARSAAAGAMVVNPATVVYTSSPAASPHTPAVRTVRRTVNQATRARARGSRPRPARGSAVAVGAGMGFLLAVLLQEQLLQGRFPAAQRVRVGVGQHREQRIDRPPHLAGEGVAGDRDPADPR